MTKLPAWFLILAIILTGTIKNFAQDGPYSLKSVKNDHIRQFSDSIVYSIEQHNTYKVRSDSIDVYCYNDINRIIDLYTEHFFYDSLGKLKKVVVSWDGNIHAYYFQDSSLVKATTTNKTTKNTEMYYFDLADSKLNDGLISRLTKLVPSFKDWLAKLSFGRTYVRKN